MSGWEDGVTTATPATPVTSVQESNGNWAPKIIEDKEPIDYSVPIKGLYEATFEELVHNSGEGQKGPWSYLKLKFKVIKDVQGDASGSRFISKTTTRVYLLQGLRFLHSRMFTELLEIS